MKNTFLTIAFLFTSIGIKAQKHEFQTIKYYISQCQ